MPEEKEHYKLTWEMVAVTKLGKYSNADPMVYAHTTQTVPNSQIPDEDWHEKSVEFIGDERLDQYRQLKEWADADEQFVRNVRLHRLVGEPRWEEVTP